MNQPQLIAALREFDHSALYGMKPDFSSAPHFQTVLGDYSEYVEAGNYPYIDNVKDFIVKKRGLNLSTGEFQNLGSCVYYVSRHLDRVRKEEHRVKMLADGWSELTPEIVKEAFESKKRLRVSRIGTNILGFEVGTESTMRPLVANDGSCWLMKPRARTRGYRAESMREAFCKIVK